MTKVTFDENYKTKKNDTVALFIFNKWFLYIFKTRLSRNNSFIINRT